MVEELSEKMIPQLDTLCPEVSFRFLLLLEEASFGRRGGGRRGGKGSFMEIIGKMFFNMN